MTRPDNPELSEHLRREFKRDLRARIHATRAHAIVDNDPTRRESKRLHAEALAAALVTYKRAWDRLSGAKGGDVDGNR